MKRDDFMSGYCLEYAVALRDYYQEKGEDVFIAGTIQYSLEEDSEENDVFEETRKNVFNICGFLEEVEVSHYFVGIKDEKTGKIRFEDYDGEKSIELLKKDSLFSSTKCHSAIKVIEFIDEFEAESFSCQISDEVITIAKKDLSDRKKPLEKIKRKLLK